MVHDQIDLSDPASIARVKDKLRQKLRRRYGRIDQHLLEESIEDALMHYRNYPEKFDATRGVPLLSYLELWTCHYLDKRLQRVKRRRKHEKAAGVSDKIFEKIVSEMRARGGIYIGKESTEEEAEQLREEAERWKEVLDALLALLNPHDRAGVDLLRIGASREEWIRHLRIEHLPQKEQQRKVNVEKDRLKKKLKRWARKIQGC
jgi:hypothetical protein